ncbi:sigma-70 family RNA polymerase sigma factor [Shewanella sp. A3A]|nr:sigma-70 family RNA polymerase sigma factor [Shewanella ferrihydritica]
MSIRTGHSMTTSNDRVEPHQQQWLSQLLQRVAIEQDKVAFAELFEWFAPKILAYGQQRLRSHGLARDLLQETMTSVWTKAHLYHADKGQVITWVFTVMRNQCFDMLRKVQHNREDCLGDDIWPLIDSREAVSDQLSNNEQIKQMMKYLGNLSSQQQQVVQGIYLRELTHQQLAKELGLPEGTVKSRLRLALAKLRSYMEKHHD